MEQEPQFKTSGVRGKQDVKPMLKSPSLRRVHANKRAVKCEQNVRMHAVARTKRSWCELSLFPS